MDRHIPVMLEEVLQFLKVEKGKQYIDATVGAGGYTEAILQKGGRVLGIDQDSKAIEIAQKRLSVRFGEFTETRRACPDGFELIHANFSQLERVASELGIKKVSGVVFDLGFASFQVDDPERGLSFQKDGPLDMRLDPRLGVTAADLVNTLAESQLADLFLKFGEERKSYAIARAIVQRRKDKPFTTTQELAWLIEDVYNHMNIKTKVNPATKVFQALRIAVNTELDNLIQALPQAFDLLELGGKLIVVSFHSGEDAIVKNYFKELKMQGRAEILTNKPIVPAEAEIADNPRSRSAKLRVVQAV